MQEESAIGFAAMADAGHIYGVSRSNQRGFGSRRSVSDFKGLLLSMAQSYALALSEPPDKEVATAIAGRQ
jgi:hypothetical protein